MKSIHTFLSIVLIFLSSAELYAQSAEAIRKDLTYLSGEGKAYTLDQAKKYALNEIMNQITMTVKSDFTSKEREQNNNGAVISESDCELIMRTYSTATLNNVKTMVLKPEPDAEVIMFIKKSEIEKVFASRKAKAMEFITNADQALADNLIGDALRYYYWAFRLIGSLRYPADVKVNVGGEQRMATTYLQKKIEEIMRDVEFVYGKTVAPNTFEVAATYKGKPVRSLEFSYFAGRDQSSTNIRDGVGIVEMNAGHKPDRMNLKMEYEYKELAEACDKEMQSVLEATNSTALPFKQAYSPLVLDNSATNVVAESKPVIRQSVTPVNVDKSKITPDMMQKYDKNLFRPIIDAINKGNKFSVQTLFTADGFKEFSKITSYGKVSVLSDMSLDYYASLDGTIVVRGLPVLCRFGARKSFNETLSFTIDPKVNKITHVSMGIGKQTMDDIAMSKEGWDPESRKRLVDFIEDYRTAYAMKDADYLDRVFDDNAIIIIGRCRAQVATKYNDLGYRNNRRVELTQMNKKDFIKRARTIFANKNISYINLHFSNCKVTKMKKDREIYGIEIKQDYSSSVYGDTGYLTLIFDLTNPKEPIIHVRTWQEAPDPEFGLITPADL